MKCICLKINAFVDLNSADKGGGDENTGRV